MSSKMHVVLSEHPTGIVKQYQVISGFPIIDIQHEKCQAKVSLYGGQVLSWQPTNEKPVFWLSDTALFQQGKAIRGGIPLCWPWFGPLEGTNQHGFARQALWQLDRVEINDKGVTVVLVWQSEHMDALWPHKTKVEQTLFFGSHFSQTLTMNNLSNKEIEYTGALHSYFCVSSPANVTVPTLNSSEFDDKLTGERNMPLIRGNCIGPIDTVYYNQQEQCMVDKGWQREIVIKNNNTHQWVLWNPGVETASNMPDIHQGGENEYVCLEAANTQWQTIPANARVTISQDISIRSLVI
jgi:glucose-6-phosphate 1-epimerase